MMMSASWGGWLIETGGAVGSCTVVAVSNNLLVYDLTRAIFLFICTHDFVHVLGFA